MRIRSIFMVVEHAITAVRSGASSQYSSPHTAASVVLVEADGPIHTFQRYLHRPSNLLSVHLCHSNCGQKILMRSFRWNATSPISWKAQYWCLWMSGMYFCPCFSANSFQSTPNSVSGRFILESFLAFVLTCYISSWFPKKRAYST